jgi:DNA-binding beta-propeller fold protein YncE
MQLMLLGLFFVAGCEDETVRGLDHGDFRVIPFESELSDLQSDISRNVIYVADQRTNQIHVFDAEEDVIIRSIPVGSKPVRMAMDPGETVLMVALQGESAVAVIDPDAGVVVRRLRTPFDVAWLDVSGDDRVFVGPDDFVDGDTVVLDAVTGELLHYVTVVSGWSPVGEFICVQDSVLLLARSEDLYKWDIRDRNASVYMGTTEMDMIRGKYELVMSNDGSLVYVAGTLGRSAQVEVYRVSDLSKAGIFETQQGVTAVCLSPDGTSAFVTTAMDMMAQPTSPATYVFEFDTASYAPTWQRPALGSMEGTSLEVSPDGQKLYVVIDNPYRITDNPTQQLRQDIQVVDLK